MRWHYEVDCLAIATEEKTSFGPSNLFVSLSAFVVFILPDSKISIVSRSFWEEWHKCKCSLRAALLFCPRRGLGTCPSSDGFSWHQNQPNVRAPILGIGAPEWTEKCLSNMRMQTPTERAVGVIVELLCRIKPLWRRLEGGAAATPLRDSVGGCGGSAS